MVGSVRHTVLSVAVAVATGAAALAPVQSQQRESRPEDLRLRNDRIPTGELRLSNPPMPAMRLDGRTDPGLFPEGRLEDRELDGGEFAVPADGVEEPEPRRARALPETPDVEFDLFAGPEEEETRSRPLAPTQAAPAAQAAAAELAAGEPADLPPARAFRTIGPVRSPTFAPASAQERVNRSVLGLRPSLPTLEDDPFAADGIRVGRFRLYPVLQQEVGVSDNLDDDTTEESGAFSQTNLSARFVSDWSQHQADITASADYRRNFGGEVREDPRLALDAQLRLDLAEQTTAILQGAISLAREDAIQADPLVPTADRPDILAYSAGADLTREFGRLGLTVGTDVVREERRQENLQGVADFTTASLGLRAGYELSPALRPFVSGSYGRRSFDERDPFTGQSRDSDIYALRGGIAFDFGEKISGEAALGYAWNAPVDGTLSTLRSPTADIAINWSPRRGTDVLLSASTFFDPDQSNLSTSTVYQSALALRHRATARTDLTARLSAAFRDREGSVADLSDETTYAGEAGLIYWINRGLAVTALARHEQFKSPRDEAEYKSNSVRVGVRLQR